MYFYGLILLFVFIILLSGCITNNNYTATQKSKIISKDDRKLDIKRKLNNKGHSLLSGNNKDKG